MSADSEVGFGIVAVHKKDYINTRNMKGAFDEN
jgi:hypothetical protein